MPLPTLKFIRRSVPGLVLGLAIASGASAQTLEGTQEGMVYIFSVTAPALRAGCARAIPDYAERFDEGFSSWRENNAQEIQQAYRALLQHNPGLSPAEIDDAITSSAHADFVSADQEGKQKACEGLLSYLAVSNFGG